MPKVSEAIYSFLHARKTPANADLVDRWAIGMETQVNVAPGDGEPVAGKRSTWSDGINEWFNIRLPKNAATDPSFTDYNLSYPLALHAEGIGMTGWDWQARRSRHFGYDFDALTGHAKGIGITDEELAKVKQAACALPYVEVRRSTGGGGIHLYVYFDAEGVPTENHTEHAALARCILGMMSAETGFDFASQIDACGHIMWIWHRKLTPENHGLEVIKPAEKQLSTADLPANWRDHIEVVKGRRSKIRVNQITEEDQDPFEALASSRKIVPLDDSHKAQIEALMRSGYTTLWVTDHHLLQTHTCALKGLDESPEGRALKLVGVFKTLSEGRDRGTPNCFLFPVRDGGWRVYRFSPGVNEAETWTQDGNGWTTCYFNRYPSLGAACKMHGGLEDEGGGFVFSDPEAAARAAEAIGQKLELKDVPEGRKITLKAQKDGRLVVNIEREKGDDERPGWLDKKNRWVRIFDVKTDSSQEDEKGLNEYDNVVRCLETTDRDHAGWVSHKGKEGWIRQPAANIKLLLQGLDIPKADAEAIMGTAVAQGWRLVNLPFREEYPGNRQWNRDAAQFKFKPAELADDEAPCHPHWDLICNHIGTELTPALKDLSWAQQAGIRTGADYVRAWAASAFRCPFNPTPYLFLFGSENCGKSIFYESLQLLVTKGVIKADRALGGRDGFNGELAGAIICAVEEIDLSKCPGALARLKDWVTGRIINIRKMRHDSFDQPNSTHWVQTANLQSACPVLPGDTRITMIHVPDLRPKQEIPKDILTVELEKEAPHFLHTLMHLELPPLVGRLRVPVVTTASKKEAEDNNRSVLETFIDEHCQQKPDAQEILFKDFYARFYETAAANGETGWSKERVRREMPVKHPIRAGAHNIRYVVGLAWKSAKGDA